MQRINTGRMTRQCGLRPTESEHRLIRLARVRPAPGGGFVAMVLALRWHRGSEILMLLSDMDGSRVVEGAGKGTARRASWKRFGPGPFDAMTGTLYMIISATRRP